LEQLLYWRRRSKDPAKWVYKTQKDLEEETVLSRTEQATARRKLRERGILREKLAGVPATLHFQLDLKRLSELWDEN
jgi:hypothetical protein